MPYTPVGRRAAPAGAALLAVLCALAHPAAAQNVSEGGTDLPSDNTTTGYVEVGGSATGAVEPIGDIDWFRVELEAGKIYRINAKGDGNGDGSGGTLPDPYLGIYDASSSIDDDPIAYYDDIDRFNYNSRAIFAPTAAGAHYLSVKDASVGTGSYTLSVAEWVTSNSEGSVDFFDNAATLASVEVGGSATGAVEPVGDADWFLVVLEAGKTYVIDLEGSEAGGENPLPNPYLQLLDESSRLILRDDDSGDDLNSRLEYTASANGVHYLVASAPSRGTDVDKGSYTLSVREVGTTNNAPEFSSTTATHAVPENSAAGANVGAPVTATDDDSGDTLEYSLEGDDADSFDIDSGTGQIKTVTGVTYDYEATKNSYSVRVKADDGTDSATIDVTINLTDDDTEKSDAPAKPMLAVVPGSTTSLEATWTEPGPNGGPAITGYEVQYRQGSGNWQTFAHSGAAVATTITELTADTEYQVQVRALNGETPSDWSTPSDAVRTNAATTLTGSIWSGTGTVDEIVYGGSTIGYGFDATTGDLSDKTFEIGTDEYEIKYLYLFLMGRELVLDLDSSIPDSETEDLVLEIDEATFDFVDARIDARSATYAWSPTTLPWTAGSTFTARLRRRAATDDETPGGDRDDDDAPEEDDDDAPEEDDDDAPEEDDDAPEEDDDDAPEEDDDDAPVSHTTAPTRLLIRALDADTDSMSLHMSWQAPEANAAAVTGYQFRIFEGSATRRVWPPVVDWTPVPEPLYEQNGRYEHTASLGIGSAYTVWLRAVLPNGFSDHAQADLFYPVSAESEELPDRVALIGNYPNPFNPSTEIVYELPGPGPVRLIVYDMIGREVQVLVDAHRTAGRHTVRFNAKGLSTGTYAYVLTAESVTITRVMVLVR